MKTGIKVLIRTEVRAAGTDRVLRSRKARSNLVFDTTLTSLATGSVTFASIFNSCKIGSSNAANSVPGNTVLFTQAGTTITASSAFFTGAMVGQLFKYGVGTGGAEQYIQSVAGGGLSCTVIGAGMSMVTPTAGTVWNVTQTGLTTPLTALPGGCVSYTYVTSPGSCGTSFPGGANSTQITLQRTYRFPVQAAPYSVSEIGYHNGSTNNGDCNGRLVLGSADTIAPTEYYVVQIAITYTLSPNVPTHADDVGKGIYTDGQIMWNNWDCSTVDSSTGGNSSYQKSINSKCMDGAPPLMSFNTIGVVTPVANISQAQVSGFATSYRALGAAYTNATLPVGVAQSTISFSFATAGETLYAICFGGDTAFTGGWTIFSHSLTTPFALPNGTYQGNIVFQRQITRILSN